MRPRLNEGHIATKFGDAGVKEDGRHWHVELDGLEVAHFTNEAFAGRDDGWVRYGGTSSSHPHPTFAGSVQYGDVRVWTCIEALDKALDGRMKCVTTKQLLEV